MSRWQAALRWGVGTFAAALGLAWIINALSPAGVQWQGVAGSLALLWIVILGMACIWRSYGAAGWLAGAMVAAFLMRLALGVGLSLALPVWGHDTPVSNAGYIFFDAYTRDNQAWELATSGQSLLDAFRDEFYGDQYGGMLALSGLIYRVFSPDLHRPWLILIITAFSVAAGVPFLYNALKNPFGETIARLAAWIYVLYPESALLGGAQMRDPILIGLAAISFGVVSNWRTTRFYTLLWAGLLLLTTAAFSYLVALPLAGVLFVWWWVDYSTEVKRGTVHRLVWGMILLSGLSALAIMGAWLRESALWEALQTELGSGHLQVLFQILPNPLELPFLVFYGLLQPILPAAIFDPSLPLWNAIATFRSLGWYALLPLLGYAALGLRFETKGTRRNLLIFSLGLAVGWALLSSFRAGGDLWDNPRYRILMMPWLAIIAAWSWNTAMRYKDAWFGRLLACEAIFLLGFSGWYLNRSLGLGLNLPFVMVWGAIAILCGLVLAGGFAYDRWRQRKMAEKVIKRG
ncbi:MAG: hypothetical protein AB1453_14125 [Chloroflexota bacterium]|jgi:hypothetical protein